MHIYGLLYYLVYEIEAMRRKLLPSPALPSESNFPREFYHTSQVFAIKQFITSNRVGSSKIVFQDAYPAMCTSLNLGLKYF